MRGEEPKDGDSEESFGRALLFGPERVFSLLFVTQTLSLLGTCISGFGLSAIVFSGTESVTTYTLLMLVHSIPDLLLWPIAGILADRFSRWKCIVACDLCAALASAYFWFALHSASRDNLSDASLFGCTDPAAGCTDLTPLLFVVSFLIATANTLQGPCFEASVSLLVRPHFLSRAQGLQECAGGLVQLTAPLAACALMDHLGLEFLLALDLVLAVLAVLPMLLLRLPPVPPTEEGSLAAHNTWLEDLRYGHRYLTGHPDLRGMLGMFAVSNFCTVCIFQLLPPLVITMEGVDSLGYISSLSGLGVLFSSLIVSLVDVTPTPTLNPNPNPTPTTVAGDNSKRTSETNPTSSINNSLVSRVGDYYHNRLSPHTIVYALLMFQGGTMLFAVNEYNAVLITTLGFLYCFCDPIIRSISATLWARTVPVDVQGRVFAYRDFVATFSMPVALVAGGPMADWLERAMALPSTPLLDDAVQAGEAVIEGQGFLVPFARVLGLPVGPGRGICFLFVVFGAVLFASSLPAVLQSIRRPASNKQHVPHTEHGSSAIQQ